MYDMAMERELVWSDLITIFNRINVLYKSKNGHNCRLLFYSMFFSEG